MVGIKNLASSLKDFSLSAHRDEVQCHHLVPVTHFFAYNPGPKKKMLSEAHISKNVQVRSFIEGS